MSRVNLKNDVMFDLESCDFLLEFNGKVFTSKSFDGVVKQKEEHQRMLEEREIYRSEPIEVLNLATEDEFLYSPPKKHLYRENKHGFLDRCEYDSLGYSKNYHCEKSKLAAINDIRHDRQKLMKKKEQIEKDIEDSMKKILSSCVEVKNHTKKLKR